MMGQEIVLNSFKLDKLKGDKYQQAHNIIKSLIINELYYKTDKKELYEIINNDEMKEGTFTYINIVVPRTSYIDFSTVESLLNQLEIKRGLGDDVYNFLSDQDNTIRMTELSMDDKISNMIDKGIIVPVVEDFLLYHKDNERYDKVKPVNEQTIKKKEDTRIRYIISKIDSVTEYNSDNVQKNPELKRTIEKNFYVPLADRRAIIVNNSEELRIIAKLLNQGRKSIEGNEYYNELIAYRMYPYINFKEIKESGFSLSLNKTVDIVRNISFNTKSTVQMRIGSENQIKPRGKKRINQRSLRVLKALLSMKLRI